jgi:hypothetical protein
MRESVYPVTETGLNHWQEAALVYKSQLGGLGDAFNTPEKARKSLQAYWEEQKGIRLFQIR